MLRLVEGDFSTQIGMEDVDVSVLEARNGHQVFEELDAPVARVILRLVLDVVAFLAVPGAHTNVLGDDVEAAGDFEGRSQRRKKTVDQILGIGVECLKAAHDDSVLKKALISLMLLKRCRKLESIKQDKLREPMAGHKVEADDWKITDQQGENRARKTHLLQKEKPDIPFVIEALRFCKSSRLPGDSVVVG